MPIVVTCKLAKANWDTYGQYLPGPSDIVDGLTAIKELSNGNYSGAAAAFFLILMFLNLSRL